MRSLSLTRQLAYDITTVLSVIVAVAITYLCLTYGIYDVFPYFYLIPIVLCAYSRPKLGIYVTVLMGWIYIAVVYFFSINDVRLVTLSTVWFYIFVSLGVVISTYSQEYHRMKDKSCGAYNYSQAGAFSFDRTSLKITDANWKFAQMIQYDCDTLVKKTLGDIISNNEERELFLAKVRDQSRVGDIEVRLSARDRTFRWALISASGTEGSTVICTAVDITEHKQAQEALQQANRKLNLLNNVTRHDILNQLTALIGYIYLSRDKTEDPELIDFIAKEEQAAQTIKNQILFTRDYQNIGVHSPQWYNVAETISLAMATIDLSRLRITIDLEPVEIYADPLLEKVFYNLIENSIRHGKHATTIAIRSQETGDGLDLIVEDDGIGIPEAERIKIFQREYFKNTGFGLFLSREILAITGLTITENGIPGKGARFVIHAPRGTCRKDGAGKNQQYHS
jgi:PAS domain S-box-containing protein